MSLIDAFRDTLEPTPPPSTLDEELISLEQRLTLAEEQVALLRNRLAMAEENQRQMALNMLTMMERLKALVAEQSTDGAKPAIILPDHFN